jgi:hypothetical protein
VLEATVKVKTEVPVPGDATGLVPKPAVTPLGKVEVVRLMAELNPFTAVVVIVELPWFPWITVTEDADAEIVKLGVAGPARALIRAAPFMLPHPVARS